MSSHQEEWDTKDSNVSTSYQVAHIVTLLIFTLFATVAVALRFWARQIQKQTLALNDYLIVLGLVSSLQRNSNVFHPLIVAGLWVW